jgi:hypothetical protein
VPNRAKGRSSGALITHFDFDDWITSPRKGHPRTGYDLEARCSTIFGKKSAPEMSIRDKREQAV